MLHSKFGAFTLSWTGWSFGHIHVNILSLNSMYVGESFILNYSIATEMRKSIQGNLQGIGNIISISENGCDLNILISFHIHKLRLIIYSHWITIGSYEGLFKILKLEE